jgi:hypothetical protein
LHSCVEAQSLFERQPYLSHWLVAALQKPRLPSAALQFESVQFGSWQMPACVQMRPATGGLLVELPL